MGFEKLRVYQAAALFDQLITALVLHVEGYTNDVKQLIRAAASVPYNIAEAFGSVHPGQKIYHLGIARGSVDEARSILRKLAKAGAISPAQAARPQALAVTIAKMLTAWIDHLNKE